MSPSALVPFTFSVLIKEDPKIGELLDIKKYKQSLEYTGMYWTNQMAYNIQDLFVKRFLAGHPRTRWEKSLPGLVGKRSGRLASSTDVTPALSKKMVGGSVSYIASIDIGKGVPYARRWITDDYNIRPRLIKSKGKAFTFPIQDGNASMLKIGMRFPPWSSHLLGRFEDGKFHAYWYVDKFMMSTPKLSIPRALDSQPIQALFTASRAKIHERIYAKIQQRGMTL